MAFAASMQWETRSSGSDANGGGFDPTSGTPGTDYSQKDSPQVTYTDLVIDAVTNTNCTSAGTPFTSAHVGNVINITSGTGFTVQRVQIMSVAAGVATCDKSLGTLGSTGGNGNLGGAFLTIGAALAVSVAENTVWVKAGTYTITSTLTIASGSSLPNFAPLSVVGFTSTHGDNPTSSRPLITTASAIVGVTISTNNVHFANFEVDGQDTGTTGISATSSNSDRGMIVMNCKVHRWATRGIQMEGGFAYRCEVTDMKAGATDCIRIAGYGKVQCCNVHDSPGNGISFASSNANGVDMVHNIVQNIGTGGTGHGINALDALGNLVIFHNTITGCTGDGIRCNNSYRALSIIGNILYLNGGYEINLAANSRRIATLSMNYNRLRNSVSGERTGCIAGASDVTLTASPFTNSGTGDLSLNNTAGGGADCRGVSFAFPGGTTTGYLDIGAVQGGSGPVTTQKIIQNIGTY